MKRIVLIAVVGSAAAGCYPASTTGTKHVGQVISEPIVDDTGKLTIRSEITDSQVNVIASLPRQCHRNVVDVVEETTGSDIKIVGGAQWGVVWAPLLILAYPVGIADVVITGAVAIANPATTKTVKRPAAPVRIACPVAAANVPLQITLPSGKVVSAQTDAGGHYTLELADAERGGAVSIRVDTAQPAAPQVAEPAPMIEALADQQILEGMSPVRDAVTRCGTQAGIGGSFKLRVGINGSGRVTTFATPMPSTAVPATALELCLSAALGRARFAETRQGGQATLTFHLAEIKGSPAPRSVAAAAPTTAASSTSATAGRPDPKTIALADKAFDRARAGNCATAKAFGVAIRDADLAYYNTVFLVDPAIVACAK